MGGRSRYDDWGQRRGGEGDAERIRSRHEVVGKGCVPFSIDRGRAKFDDSGFGCFSYQGGPNVLACFGCGFGIASRTCDCWIRDLKCR